MERMVRHWSEMFMEVVNFPSCEAFKRGVDVTIRDSLVIGLCRSGCQLMTFRRFFPNLNDSMIVKVILMYSV